MPVRGHHQLQLRPEEMAVLLAAVSLMLKDKSLSTIERALTESTKAHLERSKVYGS